MRRPDMIDRVRAIQAAGAIWPTLTANEKACVRFGMIPLHAAQRALTDFGVGFDDFSRLFCVAMIDEAARNGGMVA